MTALVAVAAVACGWLGAGPASASATPDLATPVHAAIQLADRSAWIDVAVRVRILEQAQPEAVSFSVLRGVFMFRAGGEQAQPLPAEAVVSIRTAAGDVVAGLPGGQASVPSLTLVSADASASFTLTVVSGGRKLSRSYDGSLEVRPGDGGVLMLINHVPLESYVAAVVTSEYGLDDIEGTRAMAILARTYAIRTMGVPGSLYDHVDHELSQVYHGVQGLSERAVAAAHATRGKVLLYRGGLAEAVYHAESGGHTADNEAVWDGRPVGYLRGVADPYANNSPYARWEYRAARSTVLAALSKARGKRVTGFVIEKRSADGRVSLVRLLTGGGPDRISGNEFRLALIRSLGAASLKSMLFDVSVSGGTYVFTGSGFGHGVGLSQWGAHEMARRGNTSEQIIAHYFTGADVATLDSSGLERLAMSAMSMSAEPIAPDATIVETAPAEPMWQSPRRQGRGRTGW